jgi:hypothetical protein
MDYSVRFIAEQVLQLVIVVLSAGGLERSVTDSNTVVLSAGGLERSVTDSNTVVLSVDGLGRSVTDSNTVVLSAGGLERSVTDSNTVVRLQLLQINFALNNVKLNRIDDFNV